MIDYSRKRFKKLKNAYPDKTIVLSQDDECSCFWIYDDDAVYISKEIGGWPFCTKKGRCLVLDANEFCKDNLQPIPDEDGAFFFEPIPTMIAFGGVNLPPSALARVTLTNGPDSKTCVIVSSVDDQDSKKQVYWARRADYARILYAIANNVPDVELGAKVGAKGSTWHIVEYEKTDAFSGFVNHLDHFLNTDDEPKTVFICDALTNNMLEEVTAYFFTSDCATPVLMTVFYSPEDGEYYLDKSTYSVYRNKYGLPYIKLSLAAKGVTPSILAIKLPSISWKDVIASAFPMVGNEYRSSFEQVKCSDRSIVFMSSS